MTVDKSLISQRNGQLTRPVLRKLRSLQHSQVSGTTMKFYLFVALTALAGNLFFVFFFSTLLSSLYFIDSTGT